MRRTTAAVFGTLTGTALLLAAKFGADAAALGKGAAGADQAAAQAGGELAPGAEAPAAPGSGRSSTAPGRGGAGGAGKGARPGGGGAANGLKDGLFRGKASVNPYGPIQVTIRVAGGRITGVAATHATSPARTLQVNRRAIPLLRQETLKAQSAQIDAVSGATYTSRSFAASLQSALAAARA